MEQVLERYGPVMELFEVEGARERRIVVGYKMGGPKSFFSALSDLYHYYGLYSKRKYVEQFANGVTIICTDFFTFGFFHTYKTFQLFT
jgi:glutamate dehydrogenase